MREAVRDAVRSGDKVLVEGFTHLISFAAGHEIIRQEIRDLTAVRLTPDLVTDQLVEAGCIKKLVFSWTGNPGVGSLHSVRRAVEKKKSLLLEEYSHFGMVSRLQAGAQGLPFGMLRNYAGTDYPEINPEIRSVLCPYTGEMLTTVPALRPDVAIIHVQRADVQGNAQVWGLLGTQKEAAFAAERVVIVCEEIVSTEKIRSDPNRTLIPGIRVSHVVHEPWGCHPSYAQGFYDRDNDFYVQWDEISRTEEGSRKYLDEFVYGVADRAAYLKKLPELSRLKAKPRVSSGVDYGY